MVFYCFLTSVHKLSGLKQCIIIITPVSVGQESELRLAGSYTQGLTRLKSMDLQALFLCEGSTREAFTSELIQVVGRIHFAPL